MTLRSEQKKKKEAMEEEEEEEEEEREKESKNTICHCFVKGMREGDSSFRPTKIESLWRQQIDLVRWRKKSKETKKDSDDLGGAVKTEWLERANDRESLHRSDRYKLP